MKKSQTMNEMFPNALARMDADKAIDTLSVDEPMSIYLDAWENAYWKTAYFKTAGDSPFRPRRR